MYNVKKNCVVRIMFILDVEICFVNYIIYKCLFIYFRVCMCQINLNFGCVDRMLQKFMNIYIVIV